MIRAIVVIMIVVFLIRLISLQLVRDFSNVADNNAFYHKTIYAPRGLIYDRTGKLLVFNQPNYDLMVTTNVLRRNNRQGHPIDTLSLCHLLNMSLQDYKDRMRQVKKDRSYSPLKPQRFLTQISPKEYAIIQEQLRKYPGFTIENRTLRKFTYPCATHALGRIGEVNKKNIEEEPERYRQGDYIGESGIERFYEKELRGENGTEILLRDARGRIQGSYHDGQDDVMPHAGKKLEVTLDIALQQYGEKLMQGKKGAIVAIQPATGEILALISSPNYDPSSLVGRTRSKNFSKLMNDPEKPLLERALMARYPPGSTFKTLNALIFQQEGIITKTTEYPCHGGFSAGRFHLHCHNHVSPLDLPNSIANSCNAYYCQGWIDMIDNKKYPSVAAAFDLWKNDAVKFGFGYKLGIDCPNENRGYLPNSGVYDRIYGKHRWRALTIISNSIGQGEVLATPVQIANLASSIANRGYWITPHLVKAIDDEPYEKYNIRHETEVKPKYFEPIIQGMNWAVDGGPTGSTARSAHVDSIAVCGKTGTAENPHGQDHSIFMCFAPMNNPQIAIAVVVENGGFGGSMAAPIASLMLELYLKGSIPEDRLWREKRIIETKINYTNQ